jgi:hypothetical protein
VNLQEASQLVETSIQGLNIDPVASRKENPGQWNITVNGAPVYIDVFNFPTTPENYYIQVCSPLFKVPEKNNEAFYVDLLEINYDMYSCAICKKGDWFYIMSLRPAKGLDQVEINWIMDKVSFYSNDYYSKLSFKYKGSWPPAPLPTDVTGNKAP